MRFLLILILSFSFTIANSQKLRPTSTNDLMLECMKTNGESANKQMVLWLPYNFWEIIGEQMKSSPEFIENMVTQMKNYMMFCVVDYTASSSGISFKTDDEIRRSIKLIDSSNNILKPLKENEISEDAKRLLENLKPVMAQMLGQFGEGMRLYLFKPKKVNGQPTFNVIAKNNFTLSWNTINLTWQLPLSSYLPFKYCPIDKEKMKGNWKYCPIHGVKLDK